MWIKDVMSCYSSRFKKQANEQTKRKAAAPFKKNNTLNVGLDGFR